MGKNRCREARRPSPGALARAAVLIVLAAVYPLVVGFGDSPEARNRSGNVHYKKGEFDEALTEYRGAQVLAPEISALSFNAGDALFRKGEFANALREFAKASGAPDSLLSSNAYYNAGNSLVAAGDLQAAVEAYKTALRRNPADPDTKYNLELALRALEQQQQQQKQNQDQKGDNKDQQNQNKQDQSQQNKDQSGKDEKDKQDQKDQQGQKDEKESSQGQTGDESKQQAQQATGQQEPGMSKEDAARLLDAIQQSEQELQEELRAVAKKRTKVDKDW
jgi:Ca-activated chloride channel family protein